jgi:hypothetical protein
MIDLGEDIRGFKSKIILRNWERLVWEHKHGYDIEPDYSDWPEGAVRPVDRPVGLWFALMIGAGNHTTIYDMNLTTHLYNTLSEWSSRHG